MRKNSIITSIAGAKSKADLQAVMETDIHTIFDNNKEDDPKDIKISSDLSVNDIDFDNDPYYNFDIFDPYFNFQQGWNIGFCFCKKKVHKYHACISSLQIVIVD